MERTSDSLSLAETEVVFIQRPPINGGNFEVDSLSLEIDEEDLVSWENMMAEEEPQLVNSPHPHKQRMRKEFAAMSLVELCLEKISREIPRRKAVLTEDLANRVFPYYLLHSHIFQEEQLEPLQFASTLAVPWTKKILEQSKESDWTKELTECEELEQLDFFLRYNKNIKTISFKEEKIIVLEPEAWHCWSTHKTNYLLMLRCVLLFARTYPERKLQLLLGDACCSEGRREGIFPGLNTEELETLLPMIKNDPVNLKRLFCFLEEEICSHPELFKIVTRKFPDPTVYSKYLPVAISRYLPLTDIFKLIFTSNAGDDLLNGGWGALDLLYWRINSPEGKECSIDFIKTVYGLMIKQYIRYYTYGGKYSLSEHRANEALPYYLLHLHTFQDKELECLKSASILTLPWPQGPLEQPLERLALFLRCCKNIHTVSFEDTFMPEIEPKSWVDPDSAALNPRRRVWENYLRLLRCILILQRANSERRLHLLLGSALDSFCEGEPEGVFPYLSPEDLETLKPMIERDATNVKRLECFLEKKLQKDSQASSNTLTTK
jgi:hypothetical protein